MLFLPELLNQHGLFQYFNGLEKGSAKFCDLQEATLNHGTGAILRMERIRSLNQSVVGEFALFADQLNLQDDKIVFSSISMGALLNEISPLLTTIRVLQNKTLGLVSTWEGVSLPQSMNEFIKKKDQYGVAAGIVDLFDEYWVRSGRAVKFYRDIDQHDFVNSEITSRYFVKLTPDPITFVELPDFQEVTKRSAFTYEDQTNALEFLGNACFEIHNLIEAISQKYDAEQKPLTASIRMAQIGDLTPVQPRTLAAMFQQKTTVNDDGTTLILSALRIDQLEDGRLEVVDLVLDNSKLAWANELFGIKD